MKPQDRQKDARTLLFELEDASAVANATTAGAPLLETPKPRRRRFVFAAIGLSVLLLAGAGFRFVSHGSSAEFAPAARPMVIVSEFRGVAKESATFA